MEKSAFPRTSKLGCPEGARIMEGAAQQKLGQKEVLCSAKIQQEPERSALLETFVKGR